MVKEKKNSKFVETFRYTHLNFFLSQTGSYDYVNGNFIE